MKNNISEAVANLVQAKMLLTKAVTGDNLSFTEIEQICAVTPTLKAAIKQLEPIGFALNERERVSA